MLDENQKPEKPEGARSLPAALERFRWVPGQSGNPKGPTPMPKELRVAFRSYSFVALNILLDLLTCDEPATRFRAAEAILTRGYGRGESIVPDDQETPTEERPEVHYDWNRLSNDEWKELKRVRAILKELLAKAAVPVVVEGETQNGLTA